MNDKEDRLSYVSQYSQLVITCIPSDVITYLSKGFADIEPCSLIKLSLSMTGSAPVRLSDDHTLSVTMDPDSDGEAFRLMK